MDDEHPTGALRTIEEIKVLVQRAQAGEVVKVYPVTFGMGKPTLPDLTPTRLLHLENGELKVEYGDTNLGHFCLAWRGIDHDNCQGYLFTNYWHAYAFSLLHGSKNDG